MELTFRRPDEAAKFTAEEREENVQENSDLCIIQGAKFYVRGVLPLPVVSREDPYCIGLWVEVTKSDFERIYGLWDSQDQLVHPPISALVANDVPITPGALGHEAELRLAGPGRRPEVHLKASSQPIFLEQSGGIDAHRISEYTALFT